MDNCVLWIGSDRLDPIWGDVVTTKVPDHLYGIGILNPSWSQVQKIIEKMDGTSLNEVALIARDQNTLMVGGGNDKQYIVIYFPETLSSSSSLTLVNSNEPSDDQVTVLTVQVPSEYPLRFVVHLPIVLGVFKHFFDTSAIPRDVVWEQE